VNLSIVRQIKIQRRDFGDRQLMEALENNEDVKEVYSNAEFME